MASFIVTVGTLTAPGLQLTGSCACDVRFTGGICFPGQGQVRIHLQKGVRQTGDCALESAISCVCSPRPPVHSQRPARQASGLGLPFTKD